MNRTEVLASASEYFKGNGLQASVWVDKYCLQDRDGNYLEATPEDMFRRLAKEYARTEAKYKNPLTEETIYELLKDFKYVIPAGSILYGLGNKYSHTSLGNCFVIGDTTDSYGSICKIDEEQVQLMKRRGGVGHDLSHLRPSGAYVDNAAQSSTGVVSFMGRYSNTTREVAQGGRRGALMLTMNVDHQDIEAFIESKNDTTKLTGCNISVKITDDFMRSVESGAEGATRVWSKLVHQAWATGEPGVLFWDTITRNSPADKYKVFESVSTNPCFHPDTVIDTVEGRKRISEITKPTKVYSMDENGKLCIRQASASFVSKKNADVIKITLRNGSFLVVTPDHKVYTHNRGWVEAGRLTRGDRVVHLSRSRRGKRYSGVKLTTQEPRDYIMEHRLVYQGVNGNVDETHDIHHKDGNTFNNSINNLELLAHGEHSRYTAINNNPQTHQVRDGLGKFISPLKKYLPKIEELPEQLKTNLKNQGYSCIYSIEKYGKSDVYDIQVEGTNCLLANNIVAHNCGEIPLCPYDTCRLMSINLFSFVDKPFTEDATFNHAKFAKVVEQAQRLMDDTVDLEDEKITAIIKKVESGPGDLATKLVELNLWKKIQSKLLTGRRTGLSCIGLADCLAALNIKYGSDNALDRADGIFSTFKHWAYISSETMAKERGAFPIWDESKDKVPRRNIALLTIPPSGSLAILAGITSGIEPVYKLEYTRRRKVDSSDNVAFVDKQGDKWEEYTVYHPKYEEYGKPKSYESSTAYDVNPFQRVELQATIQKHVDHSIASTINLPSTATEAEIWDIYMLAWKSGCKGITIYRDGCRDGVLIDKKTERFEAHNAPKRPRQLACEVSYASVKGEKFCVLTGFFDGKPYELFAFNANKDNFLLNSTYKYMIAKVESGKYQLTSEDGNHSYGIITEKLTEDQAAITRLISTSLRHGADIKFIVEQLNKTDGDLTSFNKAMARVLKKYIPEGTELKGMKCETCGNGLVMEDGCVVCKSCGASRCG